MYFPSFKHVLKWLKGTCFVGITNKAKIRIRARVQ